jgi:hypothetical protein
MGSKKKADVTPDCHEQGNLSKKRKLDGPIDSLLRDVENQNVAYLKYFVDQATGNFPLSEQWRLVFIPALSDTTISDQIFHILKKKHPDIELVKKEDKTENPDCLILPCKADTEQLIEVLELVGAACVFYGNISERNYGWSCWYKATNLRDGKAILKTASNLSFLEKLGLKDRTEFKSVEEFTKLFRLREMEWKTQTYFVIRRLSKKCDCFPNRFVIFNLFKSALQNWKTRKLSRHQAFAISLQLFELFGEEEFLDNLVKNETNLEDVVQLTVTEFSETLQDLLNSWNEIKNHMTLLTFDHLMASLVFSFVYQVKVHDDARNDQIKIKDYTIKSKADKLEEISQLILVILKLMVSIPKSKADSKKLKSKLAIYINIYELKRVSQKPNSLLLRVCTSHQGTPNEYKLIKLLLKAGADPNAVDQQRCSPLHLIAQKERAMCTLWDCSFYATRAENFTSIVRVILEGRFHQDQVNLDGKTALECISTCHLSFPNAQLSRLVGNLSQGVRPLSCIAAKEVRRNQLPCEGLPVTLQLLVLQH